MSKLSLGLQERSLRAMAGRKPYLKKLAGLSYMVLPRVFQGSTDTQLLCDSLAIKRGQDVWDIGTGTGLVALRAKQEGARYVLATDANPHAVRNARLNSRLLKLKITTGQADVFGNIRRKFDVITFNPPFTDQKIRRPHDICFWDKGHRAITTFLWGVREHLKPNGKALIAWSSFGKIRILKKIAADQGIPLTQVATRKGKRGFTYYVFQYAQTRRSFKR